MGNTLERHPFSWQVHELATCIKEAWLKSISDTAWCNHLDCSRPGHSWRGFGSPSPVGPKRKYPMVYHHDLATGQSWEEPDVERIRKAMRTQHGRVASVFEEYHPPRVICSSTIPPPGSLPDPPGPLSYMVRALDPPRLGYEHLPIFDLQKSDFLKRRFLVSHKRTTNLGDLVNQWKKVVLATDHSQVDLADDNMDIWL